jgi:hypothetical protein
MFYGTGPFPYIRTSDISNWEIRASPKHGVSQDVFDHYTAEQDVQVGDILFVHEGTYLIGTAAIVSEQDGSLLYQHHLAKFRVTPQANFDAHYLLAALASSVVQRQIRARQFSADIIDSVVGRIEEVVIPIPKGSGPRNRIGETARRSVSTRAELRAQLTSLFANLDALLKSANQAELDKAISMAGSSGGQTFLGDREPFVAYTSHHALCSCFSPGLQHAQANMAVEQGIDAVGARLSHHQWLHHPDLRDGRGDPFVFGRLHDR